MKYALTLNIFFLSFFGCFAQTNLIKGFIFSEKEHEVISFATVQIIGTSVILDADEKGYFEINAGRADDSLRITSIGYESSIVSVDYFKKADTVYLNAKYLQMDEVVIKNSDIRNFGILNEKMGSSSTGGSEAERSELTTLIEIPQEIEFYRISKIFIKGKRFSSENPIRLHIYTVDKNGLPGEELLKKPVIITDEQFGKDNIITIEVKDQNIILENVSFFVGVQWMSSLRVKLFTGPEIIQTFKVPEIFSYYRSKLTTKNYWYTRYKNSIQVFVDGRLPSIGVPGKGNPLNMCASADVETFSSK